MSLTPINFLSAAASAQNTNETNSILKEIQQEKLSQSKFVSRLYSNGASFLGYAKDCCEIAYRALTSLITAPLYFLYLVFKGGGKMFDFRLGEITLKRLEEVCKKYSCNDHEAKFLIYVDKAMDTLFTLMLREKMSSSTFIGVFQFSDSEEIYIPKLESGCGCGSNKKKILYKALEYYRSESSYNPYYFFYSKPKTFTVQYAGYGSPFFGWTRSIYGQFGCISKDSVTSLSFSDEDVLPKYSYHLRTSTAKQGFDNLDRIRISNEKNAKIDWRIFSY